MSNTYFQFKQFSINQEGCAMKVCTDSCLFGALLPDAGVTPARALDIGTGTGLLSLMYAQRFPHIWLDAVEIEAQAAARAAENFTASGWKERLRVVHQDIQNFAATAGMVYDIIFCNPPFFEHHLKSADLQRNIALHATQLSFESLLAAVQQILLPGGLFCVLLPYARGLSFIDMALRHGLFLHRRISVRQTPRHTFFRSILFFSKKASPVSEEALSIKDEANNYSLKFKGLLQDYYLYL